MLTASLAACSGGNDQSDTSPATTMHTDVAQVPAPRSDNPIAEPDEPTPPPTPPAQLAGLQWESLGGPPGAGRVRELVQTTEGTHTLYALTVHGVYESTDKGERWELNSAIEDRWVAAIATRDDELIVCGDGVHRVDSTGRQRLGDGFCDTVAVAGDRIVVGTGAEQVDQLRVATHAGGPGAWDDISPTAADLTDLVLPPQDLDHVFQVSALASVDDVVLAGFTIWVEGSGEHTNGGLYRWSPSGWERVRPATPPGVVVQDLYVDLDDPSRVVATFRHTLETFSPISALVHESDDGGVTWTPLTSASVEAQGIRDVVGNGPVTYLLDPGAALMLQLEGDGWEILPMPALADYPTFHYPLARLLIDPNDPDVAYGMPGEDWELGLVRSTDGMNTWHKMDATIVGSSPTIVVSDPVDPAVVYTSGNIIQESYASADGGASWQPFTPVNAGDELRIDPHDPNHLLLIDESTGLYESVDRGASFTSIGDGFSSAKVLDIEIANDERGSVYVSNLGVGVSRLGEYEATHLTNSPDYAYDIEIDPDDPTIIYATNSPKKFEQHSSVWRYDPDQAESFGWSEILRVDGSAGITSLAFDPSDSDTVYAGTIGAEGTVWVSRDHGATWSVLNSDLTFTTIQGHSQLHVDRHDPDTAFVGTWGAGSFRTTDGGATWSELDPAHTFSPTCLVAAPSDPDVVYACDRTAPKIHRSTDGGASWSEYFDFGEGHLTTTAIGVDPSDPDIVYAAAFRPPAAMLGSFVKIGGGGVVADLGADLPRAVLEIAIDEDDPSTIYVTTHLHGLFRSDDAGTTWQRLDDQGTGLPRTGYLDVEVDPGDHHRVYATSLCGEIPAYVTGPVERLLSTTEPFRNIDPLAACGVYRSEDRGATWTLLLETIGEAKGIEVSRSDTDHLYVADGSGGVWVSDDRGATWRSENSGLPTTSVTGVAVNGERIFATTQGSGVFLGTLNSSGTIVWDGSGSPRAHVHRLQVEVDPSDPERLYASAYPGGVLRSDDGGATWAAKNFLTPSIRVIDPVLQGYYALEIDPTDPETVWLGVYGKGVIVSHDGRDFATDANGTDQLLRGKHITSVAVDPQDPARVCVGAEEGLFTTDDGGMTWHQETAGLATTDVRSLEVGTASSSPFEADFDLGAGDFQLDRGWAVAQGALVGEGHTWARTGSATWSNYSFESDVVVDQGALHVVARSTSEGRYFVSLGVDGVRLVKQFDQWQQFAELEASPGGVATGRPHDLRIDLDEARVRVYLDGVLRLDHTDADPLLTGAIAFESLDDSRVLIDNVRVVPLAGPSEVYVGTGGYGAYRLDPSSDSWVNVGRTIGFGWWSPWARRLYQFSSLVFDREDEDRVYLGHFPSGFFISDDGGHTWRDSSVGLGNDGMFSITQHPDDRSVFFAGTYNGIVASTDGGATWTDSSTGMPPEQWPYTVAIDDEDPDVMYTSTKNGQNQGFCHRNAVCGVVMKSTDGGATWQPIMNGLADRNEYYTLLIHPADHDVLFVSSSNGVFASLDAGDSWWPINDGLPTTRNEVRDNVADNLTLTADDETLLLGLVTRGVWRLDVSSLAP